MDTTPHILIADDEEEIVEILSFYVGTLLPCTVRTAKDGVEAMDLIARERFDLVICDHNMPRATGGDVYMSLLKLTAPLKFVLCSSEDPTRHEAYKDRSNFFGHVVKPDLMDGLKKVIQAYNSTRATPAQAPKYAPISVGLLRALGTLPADVYIRLADDKFVRAHARGDNFDQGDFHRYLDRGIVELFAENFGNDGLVKAVTARLQRLRQLSATSPQASVDVKLEILNLLTATFRTYGFQEQLLPVIEEELEATMDFCKKHPSLTDLLVKLLRNRDNYTSKHSFLLSAVATSLSLKIGWVSRETTRKLLMCSLFHDAFLSQEDIELITIQGGGKNEVFLAHPQRAADLVNSIPGMLPDTGRIILEQHEVGPDYGFPTRREMGKISPLGQLFAFSHFLVDSLLILAQEGCLTKANLLRSIEKIGKSSSHCKKLYAIVRDTNILLPEGP